MRTILVSLLAVALLAGSVGGTVAQQPESDTESPVPVAVDSPPPGYAETGPGYYVYGTDPDGLPTYRYYDGQAWIGPEVDVVIALLGWMLSVALGPESFRFLSILFAKPSGEAVLGKLFLFLLPIVEPPPDTFDSSVVYRFEWNYGSSIGKFDGRVTRDGRRWRFTSESLVFALPRKREAYSASAWCVFEGDPRGDVNADYDIKCDVYWEDETWDGSGRQGGGSGKFRPWHDDRGFFAFEFVGGKDWRDGRHADWIIRPAPVTQPETNTD